MEKYDIINTEMSDVEQVFQLFDQSVIYQEKNGYPAWKNYDKNAIIKDIQDGNQYKVTFDSTTAIVFSVCYSDKVIWRSLERGDAVYLHRIVVNPEFKGRKLFGTILHWVIEHAQQKQLRKVRMDTWAANPKIIDYYKTFGFSIVDNYTTPDSVELPVHNRNLALTLLEYKLESGVLK